MAKYSIEDTTLKGIADAVREKEGTTDAIPVIDIAARIAALDAEGGGGYEQGYADGKDKMCEELLGGEW